VIQKKICMLGAFAVGKSSLVRQYVDSIFTEAYHTTIGVKIDKKNVRLNDRDVSLILWDVHGEDSFQKILPSYLRGMSGYLLVVDSTRLATLDVAIELRARVNKIVADVPYVLVLNKCELVEDWSEIDAGIESLAKPAAAVVRTSAKLGDGVEDAFLTLAKAATNKTAA